MKTVSKKLLSILLVAVLLISAVPFQAKAVDTPNCIWNNGDHHPAWQYDGTQHWVQCSEGCNSGKEKVDNHTLGDFQYDDTQHWKVCSVCGYQTLKTVHNLSEVEGSAVSATCTSAGKEADKKCADCGKVLTGAPINALEHNYVEVTSSYVAPSCTEAGKKATQKCTKCGDEIPGDPIPATGHTLVKVAGSKVSATCGEDGHKVDQKCSVCGTTVPGAVIPATGNHTYVDVPGTAVAPTCGTAGKKADQKCSVCGDEATGETILPTGAHSYVAGVCEVCGAQKEQAENSYTIYFVNGTTTTQVTLAKDAKLSSAQIPAYTAPANSTFHYWKIETAGTYQGKALDTNTAYNVDLVVKPYVTGNTYDLTLYYVLNGKDSTAKKIDTYKVPVDAGVLKFLYENANADVEYLLNTTFKNQYQWKAGAYWKNYTGKDDALSDALVMDRNMVVYVNLTPIEYTVYFNKMLDDATISTTSKKVSFGTALGTLPEPTCTGNVFVEWQDASGKKMDKDSILNVANDTHSLELYAKWEKEALVILRIYMNGNTTTPDRLVALDKYIDGKNVDRDTVAKIINEKYTAQSGKTLALDGLFIDSTWASYVKNTSVEGERTVPVDVNKHPNNVYVMVRNAQYNNSGSSSSNKPADTTNPKTGDNAFIGAAATVMIASAAAYVSMTQLRKKKSI